MYAIYIYGYTYIYIFVLIFFFLLLSFLLFLPHSSDRCRQYFHRTVRVIGRSGLNKSIYLPSIPYNLSGFERLGVGSGRERAGALLNFCRSIFQRPHPPRRPVSPGITAAFKTAPRRGYIRLCARYRHATMGFYRAIHPRPGLINDGNHWSDKYASASTAERWQQQRQSL